MIKVSEIIETKSEKLFNEAKTLRLGLYKLKGVKSGHRNRGFKQSILIYEDVEPIAYSDDKDELYEYAKELGLVNYEVTINHCLQN